MAGELLSLINYAPDGSVNSRFDYTYDDLGHVSTMTTLGVTSTYGYDADGQIISITDTTGLSIRYTYDAVGNRISENDNGVITTYTVNSVNEYTSTTTAGLGSSTYQYDLNGNRVSHTDPSGNTTTYAYNSLNRLVGLKGSSVSARYTYNARSASASAKPSTARRPTS